MIEFGSRMLSGSEEGHSDIALVIFFIFIGLLVGSVLRGLRRWVNLPYTSILLILGLLVGLFIHHLDILGESSEIISQLDHEGIMMIFIPILIFESAFKADWHVFKRSIWQILLLAGPGVVLAFGMIAFTMKLILGYDDTEMSWYGALMFGAILATTDPLSIASLLQELGAPHHLSTVIEGESHLNDGIGVIFFAIFSNLAAGKHVSVGHGIGSFFFLAFGGVALGLVVGFIASLWEEKILKDAVLSITIMITACYSLFWVAESFKAEFSEDFKVGVSGVIGVCAFGLYMAAFGKTIIPTEVEHPLHAVISWAQYVSETLIFIITGLLVGQILNAEESTITGSDWGKLVAFFALINVIRALAIAVLSPLLNRVGVKLNLKELFVLSYSGLRGALGLVLAMSIDVDPEEFPRRTRELVLFYTAGTALFTILFNGLTLEPIIKRINLIKKFPAQEEIFRAFVGKINDASLNTFEKLKECNPGLLCDWNTIRSVADIKSEITKSGKSRGSKYQRGLSSLPSKQATMNQPVSEHDLRTETRFRMLHILKQLVWERYEEIQIGRHAARVLDLAITVSLDDPSVPNHIFPFLLQYFAKQKTLEFYTSMGTIPVIGFYFRKLLAWHMVLIYDVTTALSELCEELKHCVHEVPVKEELCQSILEEFMALKKQAKSHQNHLDSTFSGIIRYITTKRYVTKILMTQRKFIDERFKRGEIDEKEHKKLSDVVDQRLKHLHQIVQLKWEEPTLSQILSEIPLFNEVDSEQVDAIVQTSTQMKFKRGQTLYEEKTKFTGIYLITKGEVEIFYSKNDKRKGIGTIVSCANLVMPDNISRITCLATQDVEAYQMDATELRNAMERYEGFEEKIYKEAFNVLRSLKPEKCVELSELSEISSDALMKKTQLVRFSKGQKIEMKNGGFVLKGQVTANDGNSYDEYCVISRKATFVEADTDGLLMKFLISEIKRRDSLITLVTMAQ